MDDHGFAECAERYAAEVGKTVAELKVEGIWPRRCRCRPGTDNPHCGAFLMVQETKVDRGGYFVNEIIHLTSAHESGTSGGTFHFTDPVS
jgi:hypothetical protein